MRISNRSNHTKLMMIVGDNRFSGLTHTLTTIVRKIQVYQ
jgi:hypothetical protein